MASIERIIPPTTIGELRRAVAALVFDHFGELGSIMGFGDEITMKLHINGFNAVIAVIDQDRHSGSEFEVAEAFGDASDPVLCGADQLVVTVNGKPTHKTTRRTS